MIRFSAGEGVQEIEMHPSLKLRYAITSRGRMLSFTNKFSDGRFLAGGLQDGYRILRYSVREDDVKKYKYLFFYKVLAQSFLPKNSEDQKYVLHLDYVRDNDALNNLRWATYDEMIAHGNKSPLKIQAKKNLIAFNIQSDGKKLTSTQVIRIKKLLKNPDRKTRLKMIAKQFNVSTTHLKRIETGENWGHIVV
jgi:hypothetical protein